MKLTEFIKENYSYDDTKDFYHVQDILLMVDWLLKRDDLDRGKLLEQLEEVKHTKEKVVSDIMSHSKEPLKR